MQDKAKKKKEETGNEPINQIPPLDLDAIRTKLP